MVALVDLKSSPNRRYKGEHFVVATEMRREWPPDDAADLGHPDAEWVMGAHVPAMVHTMFVSTRRRLIYVPDSQSDLPRSLPPPPP